MHFCQPDTLVCASRRQPTTFAAAPRVSSDGQRGDSTTRWVRSASRLTADPRQRTSHARARLTRAATSPGSTGRRFHNGTPCSAMKQSERGFGPISTILPARLKLAISLQCSWSPMGWMDLNEYALIEGAAKDRLLDLLQAVVPRRVKAAGAPTSTLATVLSVSSALRVQPRAIDRCTDYLGDRVLHERQRREGAIDPAGYPTGQCDGRSRPPPGGLRTGSSSRGRN